VLAEDHSVANTEGDKGECRPLGGWVDRKKKRVYLETWRDHGGLDLYGKRGKTQRPHVSPRETKQLKKKTTGSFVGERGGKMPRCENRKGDKIEHLKER